MLLSMTIDHAAVDGDFGAAYGRAGYVVRDPGDKLRLSVLGRCHKRVFAARAR